MTCPPLAAPPGLPAFTPKAQRGLEVFGGRVTLLWVPDRKSRLDRATSQRPAFRRSPAARIVQDEGFWHGDGLVLTPNRFPFANQQRILWPDQAVREPDLGFWTAVGEWVAASGGMALVNTIGAAATIGRAHAHLLPEAMPFLDALPEHSGPADLLDPAPGAILVQKNVPFCLLGVRGSAIARAETLLRLAEARLTAACSFVVQGETAWLYPRRLETPAPHFPYALGAAEISGRWCYLDEAPFVAATSSDLEQALVAAGAEALR